VSILKLSTKIQSFNEVSKALQTIEKYLNELDKSVNTKAESEVSDKDGKTGDIRTTRNVDGTFTFEVRTDEGWKTPAIGGSSIKFTDKPSSYSQQIVKSIDEIEVDDTSTGAKDAEKTIFDEKENKFKVSHLTGIPRPDYDSGWFDIDRDDAAKRQYTLTHNLNLTDDMPTHWVIYFRDVQSGTEFPNGVYRVPDWGAHSASWAGISVCFINQKIEVSCGNGTYYVFYTAQKDGDGISHQHVTRGDARILVWK
jgi:hypothetical protein